VRPVCVLLIVCHWLRRYTPRIVCRGLHGYAPVSSSVSLWGLTTCMGRVDLWIKLVGQVGVVRRSVVDTRSTVVDTRSTVVDAPSSVVTGLRCGGRARGVGTSMTRRIDARTQDLSPSGLSVDCGIQLVHDIARVRSGCVRSRAGQVLCADRILRDMTLAVGSTSFVGVHDGDSEGCVIKGLM